MGTPADNERGDIIRHDEELRIGTTSIEAGTVRVRKDVTAVQASVPAERRVEEFEAIDRAPANAEDSGQIEELADGSLSIPILEEQLVVTKRLVVRERVIVRKRVTTVQQQVEAELRSEHLTTEFDDHIREGHDV
jgi:uncharacterized protein (TIGR02271 family)